MNTRICTRHMSHRQLLVSETRPKKSVATPRRNSPSRTTRLESLPRTPEQHVNRTSALLHEILVFRPPRSGAGSFRLRRSSRVVGSIGPQHSHNERGRGHHHQRGLTHGELSTLTKGQGPGRCFRPGRELTHKRCRTRRLVIDGLHAWVCFRCTSARTGCRRGKISRCGNDVPTQRHLRIW